MYKTILKESGLIWHPNDFNDHMIQLGIVVAAATSSTTKMFLKRPGIDYDTFHIYSSKSAVFGYIFLFISLCVILVIIRNMEDKRGYNIYSEII